MNEIVREIDLRRARRALDTKPIPKEVLDRILQAALIAPSCFNNQPWRFVVVNDRDTLKSVKEYLPEGNYWARQSPCIVCAATEKELDCSLSGRREYALFDTGLAVENLVVLGYPGDPSLLSEKHRQAEAAEQERKLREETVAFNGWSFS
jgi:nitroreductase